MFVSQEKKIWILIICVVMGGSLVKAYRHLFTPTLPTLNSASPMIQSKKSLQRVYITVHIAGAVSQPGVYQVDLGQRVMDVVNSAQGLTSQANLDKVNLAQKVKDGQRIFIPFLKESQSSQTITSFISINQATSSQFQMLSGVGPSLARSIIDYRTKNGPFKTIDELTQVSGIGPSILAKNRSRLKL